MRKPPIQRQQQKLVDDWNSNHPEGSHCVVTKDDRSEITTITKSPAWLLGGHTAVIMVQGISGAYSLDRVRPPAMSAKDYCSKICGAKCCKAHGPIVSPPACPMLTKDNLCSIYQRRLGFTFDAVAVNGDEYTCTCLQPYGPKGFLKGLSPDVLKQCCYAHPELLEKH